MKIKNKYNVAFYPLRGFKNEMKCCMGIIFINALG